jgi:N-acyl-D-aspartate/D-glutamate deacylase
LLTAVALFLLQTSDVLIKGGTIVDGTGAPRYRADVAMPPG